MPNHLWEAGLEQVEYKNATAVAFHTVFNDMKSKDFSNASSDSSIYVISSLLNQSLKNWTKPIS